MENIVFSVVIPTYNRASLIMETLDSVFAQIYPHYEILVIDNCSTDNTEAILQPLIKEQKIRYIKNDKNYERAYSRNVGLENAKGDYLTLLDSDDFMYINCLKDAADFISANAWCKVFHNKFEIVNNHRKVIYKIPYTSLKNQYKAICSGNFLSAIGGFMHRDIYCQFRFTEDPKMIGAEDYEFWFHILAIYKLGRINKVNSGLREHPARSVNFDAYLQLHYQCQSMVELIELDPILKDKFAPYIGRLKAAFKLQELIVNGKNITFLKKLAIISKAANDDFSVIFTKRYLVVLLNIARKK